MAMMTAWCRLPVVVALVVINNGINLCQAFQSVSTSRVLRPPVVVRCPYRSIGSLHDSSNVDDEQDNPVDGTAKKRREIPFFGRFLRNKETKEDDVSDPIETVPSLSSPIRSSIKVEPDDAATKAASLRSQAERTRLEAERMDAELTLQKIEKLEKSISLARKKGETVDEFQRQLDNLQAKLRGEPPSTTAAVETSLKRDDATASSVQLDSNSGTVTHETTNAWGYQSFDEFVDTVDSAPLFQKELLVALLKMDRTSVSNSTEIALRLSASVKGKAIINSSIEAVEAIKKDLSLANDLVGINSTSQARYVSDFDAFTTEKIDETSLSSLFESLGNVSAGSSGSDNFGSLLDELKNPSIVIESTFPPCTRKENTPEPTLNQVKALTDKILPVAKFTKSADPVKVSGGYLIRGNHTYKNGDDLIDAIDLAMAAASMEDQMTVVYIQDMTAVLSFEFNFEEKPENLFKTLTGNEKDPQPEPETALYILSKDISREAKPLALSLLSGVGLATTWYMTLFPFLMNPAVAARVDEQLELANAGLTTDLDWLSAAGAPLFFGFMSIQFMHEIGHRVVTVAYGMKVSVPTFVPSLVTGITSTVTSLKTPPKNRNALFDFALAGPVVGLMASMAALLLGAQMTLISDPAGLPRLPVELLHQSNLGERILSPAIQGSMSAPFVPLHPIAIAGFFSLIVNALALIPIGTTDGGRISLSLFGRDRKVTIDFFIYLSLFLLGILGSDLFLFYLGFVGLFQVGNEIPARNEVDEVSLSRLIATLPVYILVALVLAPSVIN